MKAIQDAICAHICQQEQAYPATYVELVQVAAACDPALSSAEIDQIITRMLNAGKIETFEDEERGTVYVRDC